ncbi:MAG: hypothetical protein A2W29_13475 [Gemmatimonadetes bacterium RBG_16_66_8]|nr:MAG: hypothetical protein A2W29_13475 [Gemmatimonadetes bacterium RBG_16_66_8]
MDESPSVPASAAIEIDWAAARTFLRDRIRGTLRGRGDADVEDLTQLAAVRLLRALRREPARSLEALMHEISRRTCIDFFRQRRRTPSTTDIVGVEEVLSAPADPDSDLGGDLERLRFVVLEFFQARNAPCRTLATMYFAEQDWQTVAEQLNRTYTAIRKQWSRCVQLLREAAGASQDPLLAWAREAG